MTIVTHLTLKSNYLGAFLPIDSVFSTPRHYGDAIGGHGLAMWMFLTSAPKVYTIMVSDMEVARQFYEGLLQLNVADVPLHYYYNYEQTLGTAGFDPYYMSATPTATATSNLGTRDGLWYQLKKNTQLHIISGASYGDKNRQRHVCFDSECLEDILLRVESRRLKYKVRRRKPPILVKDIDERIIEMVEVKN